MDLDNIWCEGIKKLCGITIKTGIISTTRNRNRKFDGYIKYNILKFFGNMKFGVILEFYVYRI